MPPRTHARDKHFGVDSVCVVPGISDHLAVISGVKLRPSIQKLKPRNVHLYSKADWVSMKQEMLEFQTAFFSTCAGKCTEQPWQEFKGEVDTLISKYVPTKTLRGRKNLPWITQEFRRKMNQRDHLYQVQKSGNDADSASKHEVDYMLKTSYNHYLDSLVGIVDDSLSSNSSRPDNKKALFLPQKLPPRLSR